MPNIRPLSPELQKKAIEEINEVPERIEQDLESFKTWIRQQPHLTARMDDQFLIAFLRGCKYSMEKAKSKLDKYYTLRTKYPDVFTARNLDVEKACELIRTGFCFYLPNSIKENGGRILLMRGGLYSPEVPMEDVLRVINAIQEITMLEDDEAVINGNVFLGEMSHLTVTHMFQMSPTLVKKMTIYTEQAIPFRTKAQHFVHTPGGFDQIFNIFKPLLSEKLQKRLYLHGSKMESLYKVLPQKYLPKEYGGENGSVNELIVYWEKKFREYDARFKDEGNYGTNEKLRPGKPIDFESLFGLDGSFRKLTVD